ncbi:DUF3866 family protein, partial [Mesorhizobium sp. M00.F.Ca.ET.186.01.1.1]
LEVKLSRQEAGSLQTQKAISFAREEYSPGDNLLLNTTALQLQLGTGGFHLVVGKIAGEVDCDVAPSEWGHIMKM